MEYSWAAACLLQVGWAVRLWRLGLVRHYPALATFLVFTTGSSLVGYFLVVCAELLPLYGWFFVTSQPVVWALYLGVLIEVFNRAVTGYEGLQKLSRLATNGLAATVGLLVVAMVILGSSGNLPVERWASLWIRSERGLFLGLTIFCVALVSFIAYFRLAVPKNVRVVFAVFGLWFAAQATLYAFHAELGLTFREVRDSISFLIYIPCWLAGILAFSRAGETVAATARARWRLDERQEAMLTARLRSFNETLVRVLRS